MLELERTLTLNKETIASPNLCGKFSQEDLTKLGIWVHDGFLRDQQSRRNWYRRNEAAMDLAMQVQKEKSFPWPNCSNIAFPLVTIAVLQFHARAYPVLINGPDVAKARVIGPDPSGEKRARADRISTHMSYQVLEEDASWEPQHDSLLINVPCVGTAFVKSYYKPREGHNGSELVLARDLVMDYWAKSVEDCPRKTHIIPLFRNDLHEGIMRGTFRDVSKEPWYTTISAPVSQPNQNKQDNRAGGSQPMPDETTPFTGLEQHVRIDLDKDGYAEPYIITIEQTSRAVLRIVTGFDREEDIERVSLGKHKDKIIQIRSMEYFTKYGFIPSPDGGIYDVGFGILLGPLNESTNSIVNQLVDAGTMQNTAGGFLGKGAKFRGGVYQFAPFSWNRVDATGDDLRKSVFPLPVNQPSTVLFQLLALLINYTNRISGATDIMVGENPGQNTPAETSRTMVAQGEKIYAAIFKRIWRSMKEEFKKLYILNGINLPARKNFGDSKHALREDYLGNPDDVVPAADPNLASDQSLFVQAKMIKESAMITPGYNLEEVEKRYLRALKVPDVDTIYPGVKVTGPLPNVKLQAEQAKQQTAQMKLRMEQAQFMMTMHETVRLNTAKIVQLEAQAISLMAGVQTDKEQVQISAVNAQIGALKQHNDMLLAQMDRVLKAAELDMKGAEGGGANAGGETTPPGEGRVSQLVGAPGNAQAAAGAANMAGG